MLQTLAVYFVLILARTTGGVAVLPLFGAGMPRLVKMGFSMALAVFWMGCLTPPEIASLSVASYPMLVLALLSEALLGALLGLAFGLFLMPARVAGELLTQQMGLSLGAEVGAAGTAPASALTLILEGLAALAFLTLDLHHVFLSALHVTFMSRPVGSMFKVVPTAQLVGGLATAHEMGLLLAAPLALALFLLTIALALLTRAAPQLSIYSVGLPVQVVAGLGGMFILIPDLLKFFVVTSGRLTEFLARVL
jgi:flagellar biosynthetic protein FliR